MINTVIFDIGRVLIGFEWNDYVRSLFDEETAERVTRAMWATGYWYELDRAVLSDDEILQLFYSAGPDCKEEILEAFDKVGMCVRRRDWAIPCIESLKTAGFRVLFLSNYSKHVFDSNPGALDFISHTDGGIFSCDVHAIKPDPAIYQALIDKYSLVPANCLFIDDSEANVAAAQRLGMNSFVFRDYEQMLRELESFI